MRKALKFIPEVISNLKFSITIKLPLINITLTTSMIQQPFRGCFSFCPAGCVLRYSKQGLCVPQKSQSQPKSADSLGAQPPIPRKGEICMGKDIRIAVRVTAKEKEKIQAKSRKCGLSTSEYVKQRALGYEPRAVPPDALFVCLEKLGELADKASSPGLDKEICTVLKQITAEILLPGKG